MLIAPWLRIVPLLPSATKWKLPAIKSASLIPRVEAVKALAVTLPSAPNTIPLGLTKMTWPLAFSEPKIWLGLFPTTRFKSTDCELGCITLTLEAEPISNPCQLITALSVDWLIVIWFDCCAMLAAPCATTPFTGSASEAGSANTVFTQTKPRLNKPKNRWYTLTFLSEKLLSTLTDELTPACFPSEAQFSPTTTKVFNRLEKMCLKSLAFNANSWFYDKNFYFLLRLAINLNMLFSI